MTHALQTFLDLATQRRDTALVAAQQADTACRHLAEQSRQLAGYRNDTRGRSPLANGKSSTIDLLRCHDGFMQRLEQAVTLQQQSLAAAERRAATLRDALLALEQRVSSVRKLVERRTLAEERIEARRDQRMADEAATQQAWRLRAEAVDN